MVEFVEGEWKNFVFKMATPETYPLILANLRKVFYRDEPLCKLAGYSEEFADEIDKFVLYSLNKHDGLTFYAEEKGTGKVAGVRVTSIKRKGDPEPDLDISCPAVLRVIEVLDQVSANSDVFGKYGVDHYGYFVMTCINEEFRGQGLVTEIYKRSIAMLRAKGFPACCSLFSSPFTRKAAANLKFEEIYSKKFIDCKNKKGEPLFPNAGPEEACACMVLRLN